MAIKLFHIRGTAKRRGGNLPARLPFSCREGHTLVELMIGFLILTIICISWLKIMGVQNWWKESARREAVEQLHGIMDAFVEVVDGGFDASAYEIRNDFRCVKTDRYDYVFPLGLKASPSIGYRLYLEPVEVVSGYRNAERNYWGSGGSGYWLCGELYNESGLSYLQCGNRFYMMRVFIGGE